MDSLRLCDVMQSRIICSLEIHNWCKWLDCNMGCVGGGGGGGGEVAKNCMFLYCIPYRCKIEQPDTYNIMG